MALAGALAAVFVTFHTTSIASAPWLPVPRARAVGPGATPWSSRKAVVTGPKDFQFASASGVAGYAPCFFFSAARAGAPYHVRIGSKTVLILLVESAFFAALAPPLTAGDAREAPAWAGCASAGDFDAASSDCAARNMFMTELARDREDP